MRLKIVFIILLMLAAKVQAQDDPQAIKVLDAFSSKALKAPSVSMNYNMVTFSQADNSTKTIQGSVLISKDKYRLQLPDNTIYFNGQVSWSYLPAEKEVTVTKADKTDDSFMSRPSTIFTLYKSGYKCRLVDENDQSYTIDLYPADIKNELIRIRAIIKKPQLNPVSFEYKRRDGVTVTLNVISYDLTKQPAADDFTFQPARFRDVEVIDMR
ncbi:MAG TPA: LolA-like putative outer membrane lipoprotein chaperone [Bacteroidales bacterium]|nr:LolA-like putative outer membrane lipoprotein chaperone [Bacteroidales bacterium]